MSDTPEFQNPMVTIELVGLKSYTTLRQTFRQGEAVVVSREQWDSLKNETHPTKGTPIFALTKKRGHRPESTVSETLEGTGITITHNTPDGTKNGNVAHERGDEGPGPNDMSNADLRRAGLAGPSAEVDTGAGVEVLDEEEEVDGPTGHEGLDADEDEAVQLRAPAGEGAEPTIEHKDPVVVDASQSPEKAPASPAKAPAKAGPKVVRPGPRNAALKAALPTKVTPAAKADDDEVPV